MLSKYAVWPLYKQSCSLGENEENKIVNLVNSVNKNIHICFLLTLGFVPIDVFTCDALGH